MFIFSILSESTILVEHFSVFHFFQKLHVLVKNEKWKINIENEKVIFWSSNKNKTLSTQFSKFNHQRTRCEKKLIVTLFFFMGYAKLTTIVIVFWSVKVEIFLHCCHNWELSLSRIDNDIDFKKEHLTVVLMPTGTGCALTENCMKNKGKVTSFNNVIHSICHSNRKAFPVAKYDYLTDKKQKGSFFCFINVTHGYPCEVVLNSEKLRFLERKRIYLYGIYEYIFLKAYKTRVIPGESLWFVICGFVLWTDGYRWHG